MNYVVCIGIYSYFTSKYGTQQSNQHHQHPSKVQKQRNELKKLTISIYCEECGQEKTETDEKRLFYPDAVKQLACEFHGLVRAHRIKLNSKELNRYLVPRSYKHIIKIYFWLKNRFLCICRWLQMNFNLVPNERIHHYLMICREKNVISSNTRVITENVLKCV